jgi:hypothetical protein
VYTPWALCVAKASASASNEADERAGLTLDTLELLHEEHPDLSRADVSSQLAQPLQKKDGDQHRESERAQENPDRDKRFHSSQKGQIDSSSNEKQEAQADHHHGDGKSTGQRIDKSLTDAFGRLSFGECRNPLVNAGNRRILRLEGTLTVQLFLRITAPAAERPGEHEQESPEHRTAILQLTEIRPLIPRSHTPSKNLHDVAVFFQLNLHF